MQERIKFAQLHSPFFLGGKNFKEKLDVKEQAGLVMIHDDDTKYLWVSYNGQITKMPETSVSHMMPELAPSGLDFSLTPVKREPAQQLGMKAKAQVSTPTDHVFQPGAGKSNSR